MKCEVDELMWMSREIDESCGSPEKRELKGERIE